jgi:hypothetical protein
MFLVSTNKSKPLPQLCFIRHVTLEEPQRGGKDVAELIADWATGLCLLGDRERLRSICGNRRVN